MCDDSDNQDGIIPNFNISGFEEEITQKFLNMFESAGILETKEKIQKNIDFNELVSIKKFPFRVTYNNPPKISIGKIILSSELSDMLFRIDTEKHKISYKEVTLSFDENFDILFINLHLRFPPLKPHIYSSVLFVVFDKNIKPLEMAFSHKHKGETITKKENIMSLNDELFLIKYLYIVDDSVIKNILPEIKTDGIYDYNSEEFKRKIDYCDLLDY